MNLCLAARNQCPGLNPGIGRESKRGGQTSLLSCELLQNLSIPVTWI